MAGAWTLLEPIPETQLPEIQTPELQTPQIQPLDSEAPEAQPQEDQPAEDQQAEIVETWTPERIEALTRLWEEGVTTAEIGRRIGVTKKAGIGKVHRIGLTPRVITQKPAPRRNVFDFTGPACMWPIGHPGEDDFHFCREDTMGGN